MKLTARQHGLLVEAVRRYTRFNLNDLKKPLTEAWIGLGSNTEYKPCRDADMMTYATEPNPGYMTWWKLTATGALIVAYWLGQGYNYQKIEEGNLPSSDVSVLCLP